MIAGGIMLRSNSDTIGGDYFPMLDDKILPLLKQIGIGPDFSLQEILELVATALVVSGSVVTGVAILGCCGACCKWPPLLILVWKLLITN